LLLQLGSSRRALFSASLCSPEARSLTQVLHSAKKRLVQDDKSKTGPSLGKKRLVQDDKSKTGPSLGKKRLVQDDKSKNRSFTRQKKRLVQDDKL
jgi:hypothetical protein